MEERELRRIFGRLVSPEVVEKLLSDESFGGIGELKERVLQIVLVLISDGEAREVARNLAVVADLAKENGADLESLACNLVTMSFGRHPEEESNRAKRIEFVEATRSRLGKTVRIVHGPGVAHMGLLGGQSFLAYSFLVPQFASALRTLVNLEAGEVLEISFG